MCFLNEFTTGSQHHITSTSRNAEGCKQGGGAFFKLRIKIFINFKLRKVNEFAIIPVYYMSN